jgi:hypothetical protein
MSAVTAHVTTLPFVEAVLYRYRGHIPRCYRSWSISLRVSALSSTADTRLGLDGATHVNCNRIAESLRQKQHQCGRIGVVPATK